MDQETLFTGSKWTILEALAESRKAPLELARDAKTSMANVSQQLRLLEMAGIVSSERIPNRDRGQPRILYGLKNPTAFIILTAPGSASKGTVSLDAFRHALLSTWLLEGPDRITAEKFVVQNQELFQHVRAFGLDKRDTAKQLFVLILNDDTPKKASADFRPKDSVSILTEAQAKRPGHEYTTLYDPHRLLIRRREKE